MPTPWRALEEDESGDGVGVGGRRWRRAQRLALQLAFGLCGSARGSSSTRWDGQCGRCAYGDRCTFAHSCHGLSFTRKPEPMNNNSPRTFLTEAVVAASGPGGEGAAGRRAAGREAARCSCAEDREDGRGRPCALQRQVPAVLRVRSGCGLSFSSSSEGGTFLLRRRDRSPECTLHGQVQLLLLLPCLLSSGGEPAAEGGGGRRPRLLLGRG